MIIFQKKIKDHVQPQWGMKNPPDNATHIPRDSDDINADKNHHRHPYTCAKGTKKYKGKHKRRLAMKRPCNCETCIVQLKLTADQKAEPMMNGKKYIIEDPPEPNENYPPPIPDNRVLAFELRLTPTRRKRSTSNRSKPNHYFTITVQHVYLILWYTRTS